MSSNETSPQSLHSLEELSVDATPSVEDFIKELEAKERDLHITADMTIEIAESDFDAVAVPDSTEKELTPAADPRAVTQSNGTAQVGLKTRVCELESENTIMQDRIKGLRAERNEIQGKSDRRLKDFENYKYRMDRERRGAFIDQITNLASQMLPVLDNLDRALDSVQHLERKKSEEFQQFYDGIALVNNQVCEIFAEMGVQSIATTGETFDPNFHEAVAVEERDDMPGNIVLEEMLRGYRIGNRVIRHSMVKVTSTPPAVKAEISSASHSPAPSDTDLSNEEPLDLI
ncbi:MAG: nucleotide exchange factor GrpE [Pyrinomonadaceae bacterium]